MKWFFVAITVVACILPTSAMGAHYSKGGQDTDGAILVVGSDVAGKIRGGPQVFRCDGTDDDVQIELAIAALTASRSRIETVKCVGSFSVGDTIDLDSYTRLVIDGEIKADDDWGETTPKPLIANEDQTNGNRDIEITGGGRLDGNNHTLWIITDGDNSATWEAGDAVYNDTGNGNDWTGAIVSVNGKLIQVHLATGDWGDINDADGIENTTQTETDTLGNGCVVMAAADIAIVTDTDMSSAWAVGDQVHDSTEIGDLWVGYIWSISGTAVTIRLQEGDPFRVLDTQTVRNTQYLTITTDNDKSGTWDAGDVVMNDTGDGDDWTGTIVSIAAKVITIRLDGIYRYADVSNGDGIENVDLTDTDTIASRSAGTTDTIASVGTYTENNLIDIAGGAHIKVHNLRLLNAKADAVRYYNVVSGEISNNSAYLPGRHGFKIEACGAIGAGDYTDLTLRDREAQPVRVLGNNFRRAGQCGIFDYRSHDTLINGNMGEHSGKSNIKTLFPIGTTIVGNRTEYVTNDADNAFGYSGEGDITVELIDDPGEGVAHQSTTVNSNLVAGSYYGVLILCDATLSETASVGIIANQAVNPATNFVRCSNWGAGINWTLQPELRLDIRNNVSIFTTDVEQRHVFLWASSVVVNDQIMIADNRFEGGGYGVEVENVDKVAITGNLFMDHDDCSILLDDADDVRIERNTLYAGDTDANFIQTSGTASGQYSGNRCGEDYQSHKTANYSIEAAESGTTFTNTGDDGAITFTLPTAAPGLEYAFIRIATQQLNVDPQAGDNFRLSDGTTAMANGEYYYADADEEALFIKCLQAGEWQVVTEIGSWVQETP